jgi:hypothetical protein
MAYALNLIIFAYHHEYGRADFRNEIRLQKSLVDNQEKIATIYSYCIGLTIYGLLPFEQVNIHELLNLAMMEKILQ